VPRYFFDLADCDGLVPDETGTVLKGIEAVRSEATKALWEIAADTLSEGGGREIEIKVRDEADRPVLAVNLKFEVCTRVGASH
jgi:hypothetical protein